MKSAISLTPSSTCLSGIQFSILNVLEPMIPKNKKKNITTLRWIPTCVHAGVFSSILSPDSVMFLSSINHVSFVSGLLVASQLTFIWFDVNDGYWFIATAVGRGGPIINKYFAWV